MLPLSEIQPADLTLFALNRYLGCGKVRQVPSMKLRHVIASIQWVMTLNEWALMSSRLRTAFSSFPRSVQGIFAETHLGVRCSPTLPTVHRKRGMPLHARRALSPINLRLGTTASGIQVRCIGVHDDASGFFQKLVTWRKFVSYKYSGVCALLTSTVDIE